MFESSTNQEIKQLKRRLNLVIVLFVLILLSGIFSLFGLTPTKFVSAIGNYSKVAGDQLTLGDWNNLTNDFLKKTSDETKNGKLQINGESDSGELQLKTSVNPEHWAIYAHKDFGDLNFWYGDNRVIIKKDGSVGIGTLNPGSKLEVNGQVKITGGAPGEGKVLTSDTNGLANWQAVPSPVATYSSLVYFSNWGYEKEITTSSEQWKLCFLAVVDDDTGNGSCAIYRNNIGKWMAKSGTALTADQACAAQCIKW